MPASTTENNNQQEDQSIVNTGALWVLAGFLVTILLIVWLAFLGDQIEIL